MEVDKSEPDEILTESDIGSSRSHDDHGLQGTSLVQISTSWDGAGGIGGRIRAPCSRRG